MNPNKGYTMKMKDPESFIAATTTTPATTNTNPPLTNNNSVSMIRSTSSNSTKRATDLEEKKRRLFELKSRRLNHIRNHNPIMTLSSSSNPRILSWSSSSIHSLSSLDSSSVNITNPNNNISAAAAAANNNNVEEYMDGLLLHTTATAAAATAVTVPSPLSHRNKSTEAVASYSPANTTTPATAAVPMKGTNSPTVARQQQQQDSKEEEEYPISKYKDGDTRNINMDKISVATQTEGLEEEETRLMYTHHTKQQQQDDDDDEKQDKKNHHKEVMVMEDSHRATKTTIHDEYVSQQSQTNHKDETSSNDMSNIQFSAFLNSASKKIERVLDAPTILSTLFHEDLYIQSKKTTRDDYKNHNTLLQLNDEENQSDIRKNKQQQQQHPLLTAQVSFTFPTWTSKRDIIYMNWSCHSKTQEWIITSYSSSSSSFHPWDSNTTTTTTVSPLTSVTTVPNHHNHPTITTLSSSVVVNTVSSSTITKDRIYDISSKGLILLWNITLSTRPEYIFTCSSTITICKFHPFDLHLLMGGTESGQVVLWDIRQNSRFPIQKSRFSYEITTTSSTTNPMESNSSGKKIIQKGKGDIGQGSSSGGHSIIGMEFLLQESMMVTASSDGYIQYWSLGNLIEPVDVYYVPGAHFSSLALVPESHALIVGDENGTLYQVSLSSSNSVFMNDGNVTLLTSIMASSSHTSPRRNVRILHARASDEMDDDDTKPTKRQGHYGLVTGISTKTLPPTYTGGIMISKDVPRGVHGLVLTCGVDWTSKLWAPAYTDQPLMSWMSHSYEYMSSIRWSPNHPSVFATCGCDGVVHIWNLAVSMDQPLTGIDGIQIESANETRIPSSTSSSNTVVSRGLNHIEWSLDGRRMAVACADTLYILGFSEEVWKPRADEGKRLVNQFITRGFLDQD